MTDDIASLFEAAGVRDVDYREIARDRRVDDATQRWPLLAAARAHLRRAEKGDASSSTPSAAEAFGATGDLQP